MELPPLLLIDKPVGITSFDVIRRLRQATGVRKFGHAGTLDPAASGLMLIGVAEGTKALANLIKLDKEYIAEILLGERRSTGDMEGEVVDAVKTVAFSPEQLASSVASLVGTLELPVSAYSAIKRDGVPMYKRARAAAKRGETIEDVPRREMRVMAADMLSTGYVIINDSKRMVVTVRFSVGSGTYIRSLAEELGRRLGVPATLYGLRRTRVGEWRVEDARTLESFEKE